jgi:cytochrome c-type biogenesis protein CcmE
MKPKHQRLALLGLGALGLAGAAALVLTAFEDNLVFFQTPTELATKSVAPNQRLRIGGLVQEGSLVKQGSDVRFIVTDLSHSIPVTYRGLLPDLFREGQGVVAEGRFQDGTFAASEVLAKHDENYMPPEVVEALKKSGEWQRTTGK